MTIKEPDMAKTARSSDTGMIKNTSKFFQPQTTLELFRRMCLIRTFEQHIETIYTSELFKPPLYLSVGKEAVDAALSLSFPDPRIFAQHRCHGLYIAYNPAIDSIQRLIDEFLGLPTGCAKGMGGSASIHSPEIGMFGHDGLMGTQIPIAVGYAMATNKKVLAIMGDASLEEGYVLEALGFAATHKPPVLFVCVDNDLSCLTRTCVRRSWNATEHASFGMPAIDITDDPWLIMHRVNQLKYELPAFMNIRVCRVSSHANTSKERTVEPEWDRYELVKKELQNSGLERHIKTIEETTRDMIKRLRQSRLEAEHG